MPLVIPVTFPNARNEFHSDGNIFVRVVMPYWILKGSFNFIFPLLGKLLYAHMGWWAESQADVQKIKLNRVVEVHSGLSTNMERGSV
jgi:hypothetical protein